jgi:hypothetical protein
MTIVAGFVATDGVLLCADSQYTGWDKQYSDKIITRHAEGARLTFALAGDEDYGKSAIEDCYQALLRMPQEQRSITKIREKIRPIIAASTKPCSPESRPEFLAAISTDAEGVSLFAVREDSMPPIERYDTRGSGKYIANYIMSSFIPVSFRFTIEGVLPIAVYAISAAKRHDASCGGGSQFFAIRDMFVSGVYGGGTDDSDKLIEDYARSCGELLRGLACNTSEEFESTLSRTTKDMRAMRRRMVESSSPYLSLLQAMRFTSSDMSQV